MGVYVCVAIMIYRYSLDPPIIFFYRRISQKSAILFTHIICVCMIQHHINKFKIKVLIKQVVEVPSPIVVFSEIKTYISVSRLHLAPSVSERSTPAGVSRLCRGKKDRKNTCSG